jgi:hypothetical protein
MLPKILFGVSLSLLAAGAYADNGCDKALLARYRQSAVVVDSLLPGKSGQARVFAADGSIFTAGQAKWMQGQLRTVERLCARTDNTDPAQAARVLAGVEELLKSHRPQR